jgi:hypothetical protein
VAINSGACKRLPAPCLGVAQCQYGTSSRCEAERATARKQSASSSDSLLSRSPFAVSPHSLHLLSRRRCRLPSLCIASHRIASHPARTAASRSRSAHTTPPAFVYLRAPVDPDNDNASVRPQTHAHTYTHPPTPQATMRIAQSDIQKFKIAAHIFQAVLIFIALCLTISVMVKDGETGGATKFFFAMVRRRHATPTPC